MDMVRETINIGNICKGSVKELFERPMQEVFSNIDDINAPGEQKR